MAVQAVVAARWKKVTGNILTQAWGLTETAPAACINPMGLDFNGSIGLPIPSTDISIRDDSGREMPTNEVGEICVFGPQLMRGYWNRPDETEKVMFGDWLRTGDIGRMDAAGFVYIEDRKKDMILVSGFNVYPERDRERRRRASGRAGGRRRCAAGREFGGGGGAVRGQEGSQAHGRSPDRALPRELDRLQGAEARVLSRRAAEDQRRQDPAPRVARRVGRRRSVRAGRERRGHPGRRRGFR